MTGIPIFVLAIAGEVFVSRHNSCACCDKFQRFGTGSGMIVQILKTHCINHPGLPGNEIYTSKSILLTLGYSLGNGCENTLGKTPTAATATGASVQTYYYISIVKVQSASCEKFGGSSWALVYIGGFSCHGECLYLL